MRNTYIRGYKDREFLVTCGIIADITVDVEEQQKILRNAAELHQFPEGCLSLKQFVEDDGASIGKSAFISEDVKVTLGKTAAKRAEESVKAKVADKAVSDRDEAKKAANRAVTKAANKRNQLYTPLQIAENGMRSFGVSEPDKAKFSKAAEAARPAYGAACAEFEAVLAAANVIKNDKSTPDEISAAQAVINDPSKAVASK